MLLLASLYAGAVAMSWQLTAFTKACMEQVEVACCCPSVCLLASLPVCMLACLHVLHLLT